MEFCLLQMNADQSILAGNIGPNTLRQSILGYNQGTNQGKRLLQDISTKLCQPASHHSHKLALLQSRDTCVPS